MRQTCRLKTIAIHRTTLLLATALLAACGGGGGDGSQPVPPTSGLPNQSDCHYRYTLTDLSTRSGADPLLGAQWHLNNTGQDGGTPGEDLRALAAWSVTQGSGTRVAVIDDAIETLHEDLAPNVAAGQSYNYRPAALGSAYPLPCAFGEEHGTSVAGLVAARDGNALGVAGVAPRASLVGYNALSTLLDADVADALNRGLASNGVYHNSWGSPDDGRVNPAEASFTAAIAHGIATGRAGKGAIYVFPGGNGGCYGVDNANACLSETTGLDGYLNPLGVIAVCGVDHHGRKPEFAEPGANLLVCAQTGNDAGTSAITTTAVRSGYRSDFDGTSASAPMVSGVVALMLSANPELTWRDVRLILAQTARKNHPADPGWVASAFGPSYNPMYGFGVVDASAAVTAARTWASVGGSSSLRSCGPYERSPGVALPDAGATLSPRSDSIVVDAGCTITKIEYVEVSFSASHAYSGDLRISLASPGGLQSLLASERLCDGTGDACGGFDNWRFGSVRHLGEPAAGTWTLRVTDAQPQDTGTWQRWNLRIWGR